MCLQVVRTRPVSLAALSMGCYLLSCSWQVSPLGMAGWGACGTVALHTLQWRRACGYPRKAASWAVIPCNAILRRRGAISDLPKKDVMENSCSSWEFWNACFMNLCFQLWQTPPFLLLPPPPQNPVFPSECTMISMVTGVSIIHGFFSPVLFLPW